MERWCDKTRNSIRFPHFATISYNFKHRFTEETIEDVFRWVLVFLTDWNLLSSGLSDFSEKFFRGTIVCPVLSGILQGLE